MRKATAKSRHIGTLLPELLGPAAKRFGFPVAALAADWSAIAGEDMAAKCLPRAFEKRQGGPHGRTGVTLVLAARPENVVEIDYARDTLRMKVNDFLGRAMVGAVRVQPDPDLTPAHAPKPVSAEQSPICDPAADAKLQAETERVYDDDLRQTLKRLGRAVMQNKTPPR